VLDGTFSLMLGGSDLTVSAGGLIHMPPTMAAVGKDYLACPVAATAPAATVPR
jgi:hypothetical protein